MVINQNVDSELLGGVAMSKKVGINACGGFGDCLQAAQAAYFVGQKIGRNNVDIRLFVREEIWQPYNYLLGNLFNLLHHAELSEQSISK